MQTNSNDLILAPSVKLTVCHAPLRQVIMIIANPERTNGGVGRLWLLLVHRARSSTPSKDEVKHSVLRVIQVNLQNT